MQPCILCSLEYTKFNFSQWAVCAVTISQWPRHTLAMVTFCWCADLYLLWAYLMAQMVKSLPAIQETRVQSLDQEDPLEKEMANHSSILAWKIPWMEDPGRLQSMGLQRVRHDWVTSLLLHYTVFMIRGQFFAEFMQYHIIKTSF